MKHNSVITINIKGRNWHFILMSDKSFEKKFPEDDPDDITCAITEQKENSIYIRKSKFNLVTVRHEIFHVLVNSSLVESASLTKDQMEELGAEIVGEHGLEICLWAEQVMDFYTKKEDKL